ncbi:hypothetical protein ACQ4PT_010378 [Festuca glaucescens]
MGASLVCQSWLEAAKSPCLWREVDMSHKPCYKLLVECAMAKVDVDRSSGQLEAFTGSPSLKCLGLISCIDVSIEGFTELLASDSIEDNACPVAARACPQLKRLVLYKRKRSSSHSPRSFSMGMWTCRRYVRSGYELRIETMHELRELTLVGSDIDAQELDAAVDGCPHLEHLCLIDFCNLEVPDALRAKRTKITDTRGAAATTAATPLRDSAALATGAMAGKKLHPPLTPSASRLRGPDAGLRHSASAQPLRSPSPAAFIPSLEWVGEICGEQPAPGEVLGDPHASGEVGGGPQMSGQVHGELQGGSELRQEKSRKKVTITQSEKISPTAGSKRPLSEASGSLRASKSAKVMNAKVVMTQLQNNSKTVGRKLAPIVSRSPMMMARKRAQSHASSPNLHAKSPNLAGTSKTPSLHDLSAAATNGTPTSMHDLSHAATNGTPTSMHDLSLAATSGTPTSMHDLSPDATNGSKRKPRRLTSIIWKDAEPIYVDRFLMQGRCKYCGNVFPASRVTGTSQLGRHLKVCEVKISMDGVMKQIKTSDEIVPDWEFDQEAVRSELSPAASNGTPTSMHDLSPDATDGTPTSMHDLSPAATSGTPTSMHDLSPDATNGTPTSMHDLSPAATNGSKRKQRKLTSIIWKDAEPIYVDGLLMQGRCNYCSNVFPASKVSDWIRPSGSSSSKASTPHVMPSTVDEEMTLLKAQAGEKNWSEE